MYEILAPPWIMVVGFVFMEAIGGYWVYRAWFDAENLRRELLRQQAKLPSWYPLRGYAMRMFLHRNAIRDIRIINTVGFLVATMMTTLVIVAALIGER